MCVNGFYGLQYLGCASGYFAGQHHDAARVRVGFRKPEPFKQIEAGEKGNSFAEEYRGEADFDPVHFAEL